MINKKSVLKNIVPIFLLLLLVSSTIWFFAFQLGMKETRAEDIPGCCVYETQMGWNYGDNYFNSKCVGMGIGETHFFEDTLCENVENLKTHCGRCGSSCEYYDTFYDLDSSCGITPQIIEIGGTADSCTNLCSETNTITINGNVKYSDSGEQISGLKITFCDTYQITTNDEGFFELTATKAEGECELKIFENDAQIYSETLSKDEDHLNLLIQIEQKPKGVLSGTITDYYDATEISGVYITLSKDEYSISGYSDEDGDYSIVAYQDIGYRLTAVKEGYQTKIISNFNLELESQTQNINLTHLSGVEYTFFVKEFGTENPISNAAIKTYHQGETITATTGTDGKAVIQLTAEQNYPLIVTATGYVVNNTQIFTDKNQFEIFLKKSTTTCSPIGECIAPGVRCTESGTTQQDETCCLSSEGYGWYENYCVKLDSFCKADCTFGNSIDTDGICHAVCDKINGCDFSNSDAGYCNNKFSGTIFNYGQQKIYCCEGPIGICEIPEDLEDVDCTNPLCEGETCGFDTGEGIAQGICSANGNCELPQCEQNSCGGAVTESCMCGSEVANSGDYCCAGGNQVYSTQTTCQQSSVCAESECSQNEGNCCIYGGEGQVWNYDCPGESTCYSGECTFEQNYVCDLKEQCQSEEPAEQMSDGKWQCSVPCTPLPVCSEKISETNTEFSSCTCGEDAVNIEGNTNYCCDGRVSDTACSLGLQFNGKVSDSILEQGIPGATVYLEKEITTTQGNMYVPIQTVATNSKGEYVINTDELEDEYNYRVSAFKNNFEQNSVEIITNSGDIPEIFLTPLLVCEESQLPFASAVRGEKAVQLSWNSMGDCDSQINYIEINKSSPDGSNELISISGAATNYVDYNVNWETDYKYSLVYHYLYSGKKETEEKAIGNAGMSICEGKYEGDQFCYQTNVTECDANNYPSTETTCSNIGAFGSTCVETSSTTAECRVAGACDATAQYSLFGMFYDKEYIHSSLNSCYYSYVGSNDINTKETNCYYDYSSTNIDSCYDCSNLNSIYDYKSKDACEEDRCGSYDILNSWDNPYSYSIVDEPTWMNLELGELGRGLCYQHDYDSSGNCDLLEDDIFTTLENSEEVCRALGNCYSNITSNNCQECNYSYSGTKCEDFTTKETCVGTSELGGEHNTSWDDTNWLLSTSNDACHLGLCMWNGTRCVKDGDANKAYDCEGITNLNDLEECQKDYQRPNINLTNTYLSTAQDYFYFKANEEISNLTLRIDGKEINNNTLNSNTFFIENTLDIEDGLYNVSYYGDDKHHNRMDGKTKLMYVDYTPPNITIFLNATYDEVNENTKVKVQLYSYEYAVCDFTFEGEGVSGTTYENVVVDEGIKELNEETLEDGFYNFEYSCVDLYGNLAEGSRIIWLDNNRKIIPLKPAPYERVNYNQDEEFVFSIQTLDETTCTLESNKNFIQENIPEDNIYDMFTSDNYAHTFTTKLNEYVYGITYTCTDIHDSPEGGIGISQYEQKVDTETITFYNDNTAPVTTFEISSDEPFYNETDEEDTTNIYALGPITLDFTCEDLPEGFYENPETKCDVYIDGTKSNTKTISGSGEHTITYYSKDKIIDKEPNVEPTKTINIYIGDQTEIDLSVANSKGTKIIDGEEYIILGGGNYDLNFTLGDSSLDTYITYGNNPWVYDNENLGLSYDEKENPENTKFSVGLFIPFYDGNPVFELKLMTNLVDNYGLPIKISNPDILVNQTKPSNPEVVYPKLKEYEDIDKLYVNSKSSQQIVGYDGGDFGNVNITLGVSQNRLNYVSLFDTEWDAKFSTLTENIGKSLTSSKIKTQEVINQGDKIAYINNVFKDCEKIDDNYIMFGANPETRTYLTKDHLFYEISSCEVVSGSSQLKLTLSQGVEKTISKGTPAFTFDAKNPQGRFELNPDVSEITLDEFYYYIFAINELDFISPTPTEFKVVLDENKPILTDTTPNDGDLFADTIDEIDFTVSENLTGDYSGLDKDTLKATVIFEAQEEGELDYTQSFECTNNAYVNCEKIESNDKITSINFKIKDSTKVNLSKYGKYIIDIQIDDYATNTLDTSFWFGRDRNVPFAPNVSISPAPSCNSANGWTTTGDTIYTSSPNPTLIVDFTDTNEVATLITRFAIDEINYATNEINTTSQELNLEEGKHDIEIYGRKKKEYITNVEGFDNYYEQHSTTNLELSVDTIPPNITLDKINYENVFNYGKEFTITGTCGDPNNGPEGVDYVAIGIYGRINEELASDETRAIPPTQNDPINPTDPREQIDYYEVSCLNGIYTKTITEINKDYYDIEIGTISVDKTCHESETKEQYLTLDDTNPILEINAPSTIPINHTKITIDASDNIGLRELEVQIYGGETQTFDLINEDGSINKEITKDISLQFSNEGRYTITTTITDLAGNTKTETTTIEYDNAIPEIEIVSPEIDVLPNKAIVNTKTLTILIKPEVEVDGCAYSNNYRPDSFYNIIHSISPMTSNQDGTYSIPTYSFDEEKTIYFKCNYSGLILNKNLTLIYDNTAPEIKLTRYNPNPVVEPDLDGKLKTIVQIQTDDYTECKYSSSPTPTTYLPDGIEPSSLSTSWQKTFTNLVDKTTYTYYYQCENGVGLKTEIENATFRVNTSIAGDIVSLEPSGCTNEQELQVTLKTNKLSVCELKYGRNTLRDLTQTTQGTSTTSDENWATTHTYDLNLASGEEELEAYCEFVLGTKKTKTFKITLDTGKPKVENIIFDKKYVVSSTPVTNLDDDIKFEINASTDCYPVETYDYTLWFSSVLLINETGERDNEIAIDPDDFYDVFEDNYTKTEYITLLNGSTLSLKVIASNENGDSSAYTQSINIDTSYEPSSCYDKIKNGDEEGVDCGGSCDVSCLGGSCNITSDCLFPAQCVNEICTIGNYSHCDNNVKDSDETDVDCGGLSCLSCGIGETCETGDDCNSNYCDNQTNTCQMPSCTDEVKNGDETDVDCGGSCNACGFGEICEYNEDCNTNYCEQTTMSCQYPTCDDGVKNGNETDVDCGGNCEQCQEGDSCKSDEDCLTNYCTQGSCTQDPTKDSDGDGLPDWWEEKYFGCTTCADPNADPDKDGKTNIQEFMERTNPIEANIEQEINLIALTLLLLGGLLIVGPGLYLVYKQQMKQNKPTQQTGGTTQLSKYNLPQQIVPKEKESAMDKDAYLNYMKKKWGREKEVFSGFDGKQKLQTKQETKQIQIPKYEQRIETPVYDKYKGKYLTLAELKQKTSESKTPKTKREKDIFDQLNDIKQLSKSNITVNKKLNGIVGEIKTNDDIEKEDVFVKLADAFGTDTDAFSKINETIGDSKKVSEKQLLDAFTSLSVHDKQSINKNIFKVILSYLLKEGKISKSDISQLMFDLQKRNVISSKDISDVLFDLDIDFDKTRK